MGLLQTAKLAFNHDFSKQSPRTPGPQTTGLNEAVTDAEFVSRFAYPEEWARFRKEVRERMAAEPKERFYRCDNPKCNLRIAVRYTREGEAGKACIKCNWDSFKDGGHWIEMKPKEVEAWKVETAKAIEETNARDRRAKEFREEQDRKSRGLL